MSIRLPSSGRQVFSPKGLTSSSPPQTFSHTSHMSEFEPMPTTASTSGISDNTSSLYLSARQPVTTILRITPSFFNSTISSMFSMASFFASSIKPQVLTMTTSAPSTSFVISKPLSASLDSIISPSTWFLGQPRDIIPTFLLIKLTHSLSRCNQNDSFSMLSNAARISEYE